MKKIIFSLCFLMGWISYAAPNWGKTGHRATAEIAQGYLTDKAKAAIDEILDGEGMALVSTYPDDIKSDRRYDEYGVWHYINIPEGKTYEEIKNEVGPNIIWAIDKAKTELKKTNLPKEEKQFYLKFLIHLIGDLHQPLHIGHPEDWGGNKIVVTWFDEATNLHKVWDEHILDFYEMSYTELSLNQKRLTAQELKEIQNGNAVDWLNENHLIAEKIYTGIKENYRLSYDYMYEWMPTVRTQLQKGGIRLAKELNELFN